MKKIIGNSIIFVMSLFLFVIVGSRVNATYDKVCNRGKLQTNDIEYRDCGTQIIYLYPEDKEHSSYIIASNTYGSEDSIIYAGERDGLETFYSTRFLIYSVAYDNRGLFTSSEDMWMDMSIDGVQVYSGKFKDNALLDNSSAKFLSPYNQVGNYLIRQYKSGQVVSAIRMIVIGPKDYDLKVEDAKFGSDSVRDGEIIDTKGDISFDIGGGKYGFGNRIVFELNSFKKEYSFSKNLNIKYDEISNYLKYNAKNKMKLTLSNGLKMSQTFEFSFRLVSEDVSIKLENSISKIETSSRRIVIKANAGKGKSLNTDYNLYYWSKNPNDKLTYEDFMTNYEDSENKGSYTSNKGVILRNEEGTYYLYALAKDDDSIVVVRSDEYILTKQEAINKVIKQDVVFVIVLIGIAALPIVIYTIIRGKDTD